MNTMAFNQASSWLLKHTPCKIEYAIRVSQFLIAVESACNHNNEAQVHILAKITHIHASGGETDKSGI